MVDAQLLQRYARRRDAEAFRSLVERYQQLIFATCRRQLHNAADVDDAVQETFLRLAQRAAELRENIGGWLHACAVNVSIDFNRRQSTRAAHESAAAMRVREESRDASMQLAELREHLDAALEQLDSAQRELIVQRYLVGRPQVELAAEASVSPSTLSHRLDKALEALRQRLSVGGVAGIGVAATVATLLEAERASGVVPAALTANVVKIGLSGAGVVAGGWGAGVLLKLTMLAIGALAVVAGGLWWAMHAASTPKAHSPIVALAAIGAAAPPPSAANTAVTLPPGGDPAATPPRWRQTPAVSDTAVLAGRVLDRQGNPIAGATVSMEGADVIRTDAAGNYVFETVASSGTYHLGVTADGFVPVEMYDPRTTPIALTPQSRARRDIVLDRGVTLTVNVKDGLDEPIPDADVYIEAGENSLYPLEPHDTDRQGIARFTLPAGKAPRSIIVTHDGFAPGHATTALTSVEQPVSVDIEMDAGLTVHGIAICSDGKPAAGWRIAAEPDWWSVNYRTKAVAIDERGNFTLHDLASGGCNWSITVPSDSGTSFTIPAGSAVLPPAQQPVRVTVPMASPSSRVNLAGIIRFVGGKPQYVEVQALNLAEHEFFVANVRNDNPRPPTKSLPTDEAAYSVSVPRGVYRITFQSPETQSKVLENVAIPQAMTHGGQMPTVELKYLSKPYAAGTIVDAVTGKPIPHFAVRARKLETLGDGANYEQDTNWVQVDDATGHFDLELVGPGIYQVQAAVQGYAWIWSPKLSIPSGTVETHLKATPGGTLSGLVVDAVGRPVGGAKVIPLSMAQSILTESWAAPRFEGDAGAVMSDAAGRFTLPHLAAGVETLKVTAPNFTDTVVKNLTVVEETTTDAGTITLHSGGSVEGTVYNGQGEPAANLQLQFQDASGYNGDETAGRVAVATTDDAGHYRVDHLPSQVLYVNSANRWRDDGVVRRVFLPIDGRTTHLDFGGSVANVVGRLLDGHQKPVAGQRIELAHGSEYFGPVTAFATTGTDGRFRFFGVPAGNYTLYGQSPPRRDIDVPLRTVVVGSGAVDLADVAEDFGDVRIAVTADDPADASGVTFMSVDSAADPNSISQAAPDPKSPGQWIASGVIAGHWQLGAYLGKQQREATVAFTRRAGDAETWVTLHIPRSIVPPATAPSASAPSGSVEIHAWTVDGVLITDATIHLIDHTGKSWAANNDDGVGMTFFVPPGEYLASLARPGHSIAMRNVVAASPKDSRQPEPINWLVN